MPPPQLAASSPTFEAPAALIDRLATAARITVLTGSELAKESGLPDSHEARPHFGDRPEAAAAGLTQPHRGWAWYEARRAAQMQARPGAGHAAIAELGEICPRLTVITQNVDDLHERAGSSGVLHLNGRLWRARCAVCRHPYQHAPGVPDVDAAAAAPRCARCHGDVRPDVAALGEAPPEDDWILALRAVNQCQILLSVGTSALAYPAVEFVHLAIAHGATVIQVNPAPTPLDSICEFNLLADAGVALPAVVAALRERR